MKIKYFIHIGFWLGIAILSFISVISTSLNPNLNLSVYYWYVFALSAVILIILLALGRRKKYN